MDIILLGTIHKNHFGEQAYSFKDLDYIIKKINPTAILAELPVLQFEEIWENYKQNSNYREYYTTKYPEYSYVILPFAVEKNVEVLPFSSWTVNADSKRNSILERIKIDPERSEDWNTFLEARSWVEAKMSEYNNSLSFEWVNSQLFDEIMNVELKVYSELFDKDLKECGWEQVNQKHFKNIQEALKKVKNNTRILITIGAGHKGWLKRELESMNEIKLLNVLDLIL